MGEEFMERQYCASTFVIDFVNEETLLVYNKKLKKWLQPGGHIEGLETPIETCIREAKEETGIDIKVIGPHFFQSIYEPIATERYINKVGDMIDIQYLSIPLNKEINSIENNKVKWIKINKLKDEDDIDDEITTKVIKLFNDYFRNRLG